MFTANQTKALPPLNAKNPTKTKKTACHAGFTGGLLTICTISGAKIDTVYHSLWRTETHAAAQTAPHRANKRLFSKISKKIGKKDMNVVTNGGMWCILIVSLGEVYPN